VTLAFLALAAIYLRGWHHLWKVPPKEISVWRLTAFTAGILSLWAAVASPLGALDEQLLTAHMMQHLLLMTVAAPLFLLAAPWIVLLHGLPRPFVSSVLGPVLRSRPVHLLGGVLASPVVCWFAGTIVVIGWHVPAAFNLALQSHHWHEIEHASFLAAGLLFWWPVIRPRPSAANSQPWSVPLYLFVATFPCDALSAYLVFCDRVVYRQYQGAFNISALEDQAFAGALMWVTVTFAYLIPALIVTLRILSRSPGHASEVSGEWVRLS
jgi:putative membrane protein